MWKFLLHRLEEQDFDFEWRPVTDIVENTWSTETGFGDFMVFPFLVSVCQLVINLTLCVDFASGLKGVCDSTSCAGFPH